MTTKQRILEAIQKLPDDATIDDVMECLLLLDKIERGLKDIAQGKVVSDEEARQRMANWLKE